PRRVRRDPVAHRAVPRVGGRDVADGPAALPREPLGVRALARARAAEDERQAHDRAPVGSRAAAATSRCAACGKAAQCTCRYDAWTPPATKPSARVRPRAVSSQAAVASPATAE